VHVATLELDAGPILAQGVVPVLPGDTEASLHERIKVAERSLYPATVAWALAELEAGRDITGPGRRSGRVAVHHLRTGIEEPRVLEQTEESKEKEQTRR
jgi:methionyl-tRNA formyltransferase